MKLKKIFYLLVAALLFCPFAAGSAETFEVVVEDSILAYAGQPDLEVPVYFEQSDGVYYFRVEVEYDPSKLEFLYASTGRFGSVNAHTNFCGPGFLHVFAFAGGDGCAEPGSEPAFYIHFAVDGGVSEETVIPLTFNDPFCYSLQAVVNGCAPSYPTYIPTYDFGSVYIPPVPEFEFAISENIPAYPGQPDLEVPVYFDQGAGVYYFRVEVEYDASKLEFLSVSGGRFTSFNAHTDFCGPGFLHVFGFAGGAEDCTQPGSEPAFYIHFRVDGSVPGGTTIPLIFNDPFCYSLQAVVNGCAPEYPAYSATYDFGSVYVEALPEFEVIIADNISAYPGQSDLEVPVYLDQGVGVNYFRVELEYDPNQLQYRFAEAGRFGILNAHTDFCGPGFLHVFLTAGAEGCIQPGSEPAFYVHFKVQDTVSVGNVIPLVFNNPFCYSLQAVVNGCAPDYFAYIPTYDFGSVFVDHRGVKFTLPDNVLTYAGSNARLPVYVHNEEGLIYFRVDMAYDPDKLIYQSVEDARFAVTNTLFCGDDPAHVSVFSTNGHCILADPDYPGGVGFYITFKVQSGVPVGTVIPITFTDTTCNLILTLANGCEPMYSTFLPEWDHGSIKVKSQPSPGCPFVFAWTGERFEKDNTILTQSEDPYRSELSVTDHLLLRQKPALVQDEYRLQIREFEQEVSYLDNLELIVVDHALGTEVAVSPDGEIHLYENEIAPLSCTDHNGVDQLDKIREKDGVFYTCDQAGHLVLTLKQEVNSEGLPSFVVSGVGPRPPPKNIPKTAGSPEPSMLKIEIQAKDGSWIELSDLPPRDSPQKSFCFIDPQYVDENGEMKIRISWTGFYSADEISYFLVSSEKPELYRNLPVRASHSASARVLSRLEQEDGEFVVLSPGEKIELVFLSPGNPKPDVARDFVLRSRGYYVQQHKTGAPSLPSVCQLLDNYPNPFNMETIISYVLSQEANVQLRVYNVLGERVRTLVDERQTPGTKKVSWDGKDERGEDVTSGVYFYKLKAGASVHSKKMLLLK